MTHDYIRHDEPNVPIGKICVITSDTFPAPYFQQGQSHLQPGDSVMGLIHIQDSEFRIRIESDILVRYSLLPSVKLINVSVQYSCTVTKWISFSVQVFFWSEFYYSTVSLAQVRPTRGACMWCSEVRWGIVHYL